MKILLAPNAYKESLSAGDVARAMARGIRQVIPSAQIIKLPIGDGGDGTLEVLTQLTRGRIFTKKITDPLGVRRIKARWGLLGIGKKTAVIEMAEAAGIRLIPPRKRTPLITHTYGVGELIKAALDRKVRRIIIGLGGSATVEAGTGLARALGIRFLACPSKQHQGLPGTARDKKGNEIDLGGGALRNLAHIDMSGLDARVKNTEFIGAYDVVTPLVGAKGAAHTFGPQKGANKREVDILEHNLRHLARIIRQDIGINVRNIKGGGAAGGLGAGLYAFLGAKLISGTELFLELADYKKQLKGVDLVITGEGKLDGTTILGKAPIVVAQATKKIRQIPVIAICGSIGPGADKVLARGIDAYFSISLGNISRSQAIRNAPKLITQTTERVVRRYLGLASISSQ